MLKNYLIMACKVLLRRKFFTLISLICISTTLAILMVAATIADNFIGNVPPETKKDRTLGVNLVTYRKGGCENCYNNNPPGYAFLNKFVDIKTLPHIEMASIFSVSGLGLGVEALSEGASVNVALKKTDADYWSILEFDFLEGGPITKADVANADHVTIINQSTRKALFGADSAVGRSILIDGIRYKIKGVVKDVSALQIAATSDVWVPVSTSKTKAYLNDGYTGAFHGFILAKSRTDFPLIKNEFRRRVKEVPLPDGVIEIFCNPRTPLELISDIILAIITGEISDEDHTGQFFMILVIIVILFLILPIINIVNINFCRISERASEIGVRKSFGASSLVLIGQFVTENFILTLIGGSLGVFLSLGAIYLLNASDLYGVGSFYFHHRMFLVGLVAIFIFNLLSGTYPAWRMSRFHPVDALRMNM